ncbi:MAG: Asp-tRNA(Asn)/Glu-tRNA(Gln) amidotransferase subunit GatB [Patescibacteria group bacterium]
MKYYIPTIGLEIHAELKTRTKMFCDSKNDPEEKRPNVNICPVCMAHPGTLPVINKEAVKHVLKVGKAISGELADFTEFDRKNYFYPDIPKGYQISQYKYPLVKGGQLAGVLVTRVHLEEDTATSKHDRGEYSLVDFNRAGVPLMELVTEPVIKDAQTAVRFAKELQLLLRYLGASDANMEKGEMRVEANISVSPEGSDKFGTKVEVKNLNSFKVVEKAIKYEIERQTKAIESGEEIIQETRGWDEKKQETFSQRKKESSHDYRYFPDPDLPKLKISEIPEFQKLELPELPWEKRERYKKEYGIKDEDIEMYVQNELYQKFFESVAVNFKGDKDEKKLIQLASNYITSDIAGKVSIDNIEWPAWLTRRDASGAFAKLIHMVSNEKVSSRGAKDILHIMFLSGGGDPEDIAQKEGLFQKSDTGELKAIAEKIISENEKVAAEYKAGKEASLQYLVGQIMRATKGAANPVLAGQILKEILK